MEKTLTVQEMAIAVAAKNLNPTALNLDFLKYSDIIPSDWELARPPVYTNQLVQLFFQNGVGVIAQPRRVVVAEAIGAKEIQSLQAAAVACQCIKKLPKLDYQEIGLNFTGYVPFDSEDAAYQYLCQTLLSPGAWQEFGEARMKAGLQLAYTLEQGQLNLGINQATVNFPDQSVPAILFSGNFNTDRANQTQLEWVQTLEQIIQNWSVSLDLYQQLIHQKFLQQVVDPLDRMLFGS